MWRGETSDSDQRTQSWTMPSMSLDEGGGVTTRPSNRPLARSPPLPCPHHPEETNKKREEKQNNELPRGRREGANPLRSLCSLIFSGSHKMAYRTQKCMHEKTVREDRNMECSAGRRKKKERGLPAFGAPALRPSGPTHSPKHVFFIVCCFAFFLHF